MAKLTREKIPFTQVANVVLNDKDLSMKAKGIFAYMFSKPDGWQFSAERISMDTTDNRTSILSGIKELKENGYLECRKLGNGRVQYYLKYSQNPESENLTLDADPKSENPTMRKPHNAKIEPISNIVINNNKDKESNIIAETSSAEIVALIDLFREWNIVAKDWYRNKTERNACKWLLEEFGLEKSKEMIKYLPTINAIPYAPITTSPSELKRNYTKLKAFGEKQRSKLKTREFIM